MNNSEKTPKRCAIYTRKSVEEGLEMEFNSLDAQREAGEAYITSQRENGWVCLPQHYDDGGYTGGNIDRPALQQLLQDAEAGRINAVVVYKIDRLSRSICDFAELLKKFEQWNVAFVSVTQEINTHTSSGRMMLNILVTFAQFEREIIAERVRDKMSASRLKGKWMGGARPLGYRNVDKHLVVDLQEAELVRRIFQRYVEIQSPKQIALELNRDGVTTRAGHPWTRTAVHLVLNNFVYAGKINFRGTVVEGEQAAIITPEVWEQVREFLKSDAPQPCSARSLDSMAPLKGILRCGHCGSAMTPVYSSRHRGSQRYYYYRCLHKDKLGESDCPVRQVPAGEIERLVFEQLARVLAAPDIVVSVAKVAGVPAARVMDLFAHGFWKEITTAEKQRLAELLLDRVEVQEDGVTIIIKSRGVKSIIEEVKRDAKSN